MFVADNSRLPPHFPTSPFRMDGNGNGTHMSDHHPPTAHGFAHATYDDPRNGDPLMTHHHRHPRPRSAHPPRQNLQHQQHQHQQQEQQHPRTPQPRAAHSPISGTGSSPSFRGRDFFQCPELDQRMKKYLVKLANETANHLIRDTLEPQNASLEWKSVTSIKGISILRGYERSGPSTPTAAAATRSESNAAASTSSDSTCLRGVAEVNASIEEFAMLFKLDTNKKLAEHGLLFNPDLLDMATLYSLVQPSGDHPRRYVGIKWCLMQSPSRIFRNRDFCYLECQKEFQDANGRRGWVRSMHSIKMPCCPALEKSHSIVRASLYRCGLIAVETDKPGVLDTTYTIEMDLKGHFPEIFQPKFLSQRIAALASIDKFLQQQRLSSSPLLGDLDLPANKMKSACQFCFREFSTFTRRHICRKCGEGICRHCSDDWMLDIPVIGRKKVRICTVCSAEARFCHIAPMSARGSLMERGGGALYDHDGKMAPVMPHQYQLPRPYSHEQKQQQYQHHAHHQQQRGTLPSLVSMQSMPRSVSLPSSEYDNELDPREYFAMQQQQIQVQFDQEAMTHGGGDRESHEQYFATDYAADFDDFYNGTGGAIRGTTDLSAMWQVESRPSLPPQQPQQPPSSRGSFHQPMEDFFTPRRVSNAVPMVPVRRGTIASDSHESQSSQRSRAQTVTSNVGTFHQREPHHYTPQSRNTTTATMDAGLAFPPSSRYTVVGNRLERANSYDAARNMEDQFHRQQQQQQPRRVPPSYTSNSRRSHQFDAYPSSRRGGGGRHQQQQPPSPSLTSGYQHPHSNVSSPSHHYHQQRASTSSRQSYRQPPASGPRNVALEFVTQHLPQNPSPAAAPFVKPMAPLPQAPMFQFGTTVPKRSQPQDDSQHPDLVAAGEVEYIESESGEWIASRSWDKKGPLHVPFLDLETDEPQEEPTTSSGQSSSGGEAMTLASAFAAQFARKEGNATSPATATTVGNSSNKIHDADAVVPILVERLSQQSLHSPLQS